MSEIEELNCKNFSIDECPIPICTKKARPPMGFSGTEFYCGNNNLIGINNYCKKKSVEECPSPFCTTLSNTTDDSINERYCGANEEHINKYLKS